MQQPFRGPTRFLTLHQPATQPGEFYTFVWRAPPGWSEERTGTTRSVKVPASDLRKVKGEDEQLSPHTLDSGKDKFLNHFQYPETRNRRVPPPSPFTPLRRAPIEPLSVYQIFRTLTRLAELA
jgi:hypothetical protein